jgi:hypothetical protein
MRCRVPRSAVSSRDVHGRGGLRAISATGNIAWHRGGACAACDRSGENNECVGHSGLRGFADPRKSGRVASSLPTSRCMPSKVNATLGVKWTASPVPMSAAASVALHRGSRRLVERRPGQSRAAHSRGLIGRSSCVVYGWCGARVRLRNRIVTSVPSSQPRIAANSVSQTSGTVECANTQSTRTSRVFVVASATT